MESSFRRSMLIFDGDPTGFVTRPISGAILTFLVLVLALPLVKLAFRRRTSPTPTSEDIDQEAGVR